MAVAETQAVFHRGPAAAAHRHNNTYFTHTYPRNPSNLCAVHQALLRAISKHNRRDAGLLGVQGQVLGAAISVAQQMSSNLQLNLHRHVLLAHGVWTESDGPFHPAGPLDTLRVQETLVPFCAPLVQRLA